MLSPYQYASNSPIAGIDLEGGEFKYYSLRWQPQADGKSHLRIDNQINSEDRIIGVRERTTGDLSQLQKLSLPYAILQSFGVDLKDVKSSLVEIKMSQLGIKPNVVSPDGKMWKVVPSYMDLQDLPDLNSPLWDQMETPDEYFNRLITEGNQLIQNAQNYGGAVRTLGGSLLSGKLGISKLKRFDGPKPQYHINEKHVKLRKGQNATKLPGDAEDVFKNAVPDDPVKPKHWYGKNKDGSIYRFSSSNDGKAHFSGRSDEGDGIKNMTDYAKERLNNLGNN